MTALVIGGTTDESWGRGTGSAAADLLRPVAVCHVLACALAGEVRDVRPAPGLGVGLGDRGRQIPALHPDQEVHGPLRGGVLVGAVAGGPLQGAVAAAGALHVGAVCRSD